VRCNASQQPDHRIFERKRRIRKIGRMSALVVADPDASGERRFVCLGSDPQARALVTVFAHAGDKVRIISSRQASRGERRRHEKG
jgi:uncharacterized DUF497 family protein